jgi:hypothetical protein
LSQKKIQGAATPAYSILSTGFSPSGTIHAQSPQVWKRGEAKIKKMKFQMMNQFYFIFVEFQLQEGGTLNFFIWCSPSSTSIDV